MKTLQTGMIKGVQIIPSIFSNDIEQNFVHIQESRPELIGELLGRSSSTPDVNDAA